MRLRWSEAAALDLEDIHDYLKNRHPALARSTVLKLYDAVRSLTRMPNLGRLLSGTERRELILRSLPYVIVYRIDVDRIHVLRVFHISRDRR
jgi:toxin ParE1/3/4